MIVTDMLAWWYTNAWLSQFRKAQSRVLNVLGAFSVGLLSRTLFATFRQIDAGAVRGSLGVQLRAWFDRAFSRFVGFWVRVIVILSACVTAFFVGTLSLLWALFWPLIPILPILGIVLTLLQVKL